MVRFWAKVRRTSGCWEWLASRSNQGYGTFQLNGKSKRAHRVSWELSVGPIPPGMCVCHHCDNRGCVRPGHLFLGTHQDNMRDAQRKGRLRGMPGGLNPACRFPEKLARGERNPNASMTQARVDSLRARRAAGVLQKDLAREFGISQATVSQIVRGVTWKSM